MAELGVAAWTRSVGGGLAIMASVAACRSHAEPIGTRREGIAPMRGGVLHVAAVSDLRTLDPAVAFDTESQPYLELIYAGLVDYDGQGNVIADLAERWEMSEDGRTYRFFLRHGVQMQDGGELTADDVRRSVERTLHPDTPCPALSLFSRIEGLDDYQARRSDHLAGVHVEAPYVVSFSLREPDATFLAVLAMPFLRPVCKSAGTRYDDAFQKHACGAGPFRVESWEPGRALRLARFAGYFRAGLPYLDGVDLRMDVQKLPQRLLFERGELDFLNEFERPDYLYFRSHPQWSRYGVARIEPAVYGEFMNTEMRPFDDVRVRQAVAAAIDRVSLAKYMEGASVVTGHLLPPGVPGYDPNFPGQVSDLPRARRLMSEAGFAYDPATGAGGYPEAIQYLTGEGNASERWAQLMQYDLAQIGLRLEIKVASFSQYLALVGRPYTVKMGFAGWNLDYPDPSDFFEPTFSSRAIAQEESQNRAFYRNPTLDALLDRAHVELNHEKRLAMYRVAEKIVCDDAPWAMSYYPMRYELTQPYVRDYVPHPVWQRYFKTVWIDEAGKRMKSAMLGPGRATRALGSLLFRGDR